MNDYIQYVLLFDPLFETKIQGAKEDDILKLAELTKHDLPIVYKDYLLKMGINNGGINFAQDHLSSIDDIIDFYQEDMLFDDIKIPENYIVVGCGSESYGEFLLDIEKDPIDPPVYINETAGINLYSDSFEKLLYRTAFVSIQPEIQNSIRLFTAKSKDALLKKAEKIASDIGFEKHWFSDSISYCGETDNSALHMLQLDNSKLIILLMTVYQEQLNEIGSKFTNEIEFSWY